MAKAHDNPKSSAGKNKLPSKSRETTTKLARPRKTPLTRKGMPPERLLTTAGSISTQMLDAMEKAIDEGCGRAESHGQ